MSRTNNLEELRKLSNEEITLYVLNDRNKYITKEFIENLLEKYGVKHKVKYLENFQQAMTHTSYLKKDFVNDKATKMTHIFGNEKQVQPIIDPKKAIGLQEEAYERLEFLGDSVIHLALAEYLYTRYSNEYEGFMTRLRTKLENGQTLAQLTKAIGLNEYVIISQNIEQCGGRNANVHILEDAFESFVGALYLDVEQDEAEHENEALNSLESIKEEISKIVKNENQCSMIMKNIKKKQGKSKKMTSYPKTNYELCKKFVTTLIEKEIDIAQLLYHDTNYKDSLLQFYHKMKWTDPIYDTLETVGDDHKKQFRMCVRGPDKAIVGTGMGTSKKKGEQIAAQQALLYFGVLTVDSESDSDQEEIGVAGEECEMNANNKTKESGLSGKKINKSNKTKEKEEIAYESCSSDSEK